MNMKNKKQTLETFFGKGKGKIKDVRKAKYEARKLWKKMQAQVKTNYFPSSFSSSTSSRTSSSIPTSSTSPSGLSPLISKDLISHIARGYIFFNFEAIPFCNLFAIKSENTSLLSLIFK